MWNFLAGLATIAMIPLFLLNTLSGVVGGIMLAMDGQWRIIGLGLASGFLGPIAISIALIPGMALSVPAFSAYERTGVVGKILSAPFLLVSMGWTIAVMGIWGWGIFTFLGNWNYYRGADLAHVLWAYSAATAPWAFLAQKDAQGGNFDSGTSLLFFEVACLFVALGFWRHSEALTTAGIITMAILLVFSLGRGALLLIQGAMTPGRRM